MNRAIVIVALSVAGSGAAAIAQAPALTFHTEDPSRQDAREEYERMWANEGAAMIAALENLSGLRFPVHAIEVEIIDGPSWAGSDRMGMRATYPPDTKRATLMHELGHVLVGDLFEDATDSRDAPDDHYVLFLFLYDAWVDLYGKEFADEQVAVESARRGGTDYEGIWRRVLARGRDARAAELRELLEHWGRSRR